MMIKKLSLLSTFLFTVFFAFGQSFTADRIISIVGDKIILESDIEIQYHQFRAQAEGVDIPSEDLRCEILEDQIMQKLLLVQAQRDSIEISDEEVDGEMERRLRYFISMIGSQEELERYYGKTIDEIKAEFRDDIRNQLLANQMQSRIVQRVKVSPSEVKDFFQSIPEDSLPYFNAEVEVGQIVIYPKISDLQSDLARERISEIRQRALGGENFGTLALLFSQDPGSANNEGSLGFIERGQGLAPEFEGAAFRLREGEISPIIETQFGFHIIKANERLGDRMKVQHILIRPQITSFELNAARDKLDTIKNKIVSGEISFHRAVANYCQHDETKMNGGLFVNQETGNTFFELDQLDREVFTVVTDLKEGEISNPIQFKTRRGDPAYRIVYLKSETEPHVANLEQDYHKIQAAALSYKKQREMVKWMGRRFADTYIQVSDNYQDCSSINEWLDQSEVTLTK